MVKGSEEAFLPRHEGCHTVLMDDGQKQEIPVCMGGMAIIGCNDFVECIQKQSYVNNLNEGYVVAYSRNNEGRVVGATRVRRQTAALKTVAKE